MAARAGREQSRRETEAHRIKPYIGGLAYSPKNRGRREDLGAHLNFRALVGGVWFQELNFSPYHMGCLTLTWSIKHKLITKLIARIERLICETNLLSLISL